MSLSKLKWNSQAKVCAAFLLVVCGLPGFAFADALQIDSESVRRVASHIACQCKACKETAVCPMSMQGCGFCVPAKAKIVKMQQAGFSDQAIIDAFMKEYGADIYRAGPSSYFWLVPYGALVLGAGAILWFVTRYYKGGPATALGPAIPDDPSYARYREAIEKEAARLDLQ
jgi:cytochrome c-type biogenesis protein CcmH/NrfF